MYAQVNAGRNINQAPMSAEKWRAFQDQIANALTRNAVGSVHVEFHDGGGEWDETPEDSVHVSCLAESFNVGGLRDELKHLKKTYQQDSVALILGSELV